MKTLNPHPFAHSALKISGIAMLMLALASCGKSQDPESLLSDAKQYHQKGDHKAAIIQLKNVLQAKPDDREARFMLGSIYNETNDAVSAEKEIRRAIELGMPAAEAAPQLARALFGLRQYDKLLSEVPASAQPDATIDAIRGDALLAQGKTKEARASYLRAQQDQPESLLAVLGLAKIAFAEGDVDGALRLAEQAVANHPSSNQAMLLKADLLRSQNKTDAALAAYADAIKLDPGHVPAYISKANLEINGGNLDAAAKDIDAARKIAPTMMSVIYSQSLLDFHKQNYPAALESIQQILKAAPDHPPSNLLAAAIQRAQGSYAQAEMHARKYLEQNPNNLYAMKLMATIQLQNNQPQRALDAIEPALKASTADPQLQSIAGEAHMRLRNYSQATEYFERATSDAPEATMIRAALAMSSLAQGDNERAIAELEQAVKLDPKASQPNILLAMTHLRQREYDKALEILTTAQKQQPDNPMLYNLMGGAWLGKGDQKQARASFEGALAKQPDYFFAVVNLAQLDIQDKKPADARKRLESFLAKQPNHIQALQTLANFELSQNNNAKATEVLERASSAHPDNPQLAARLGMHYLRMKEQQKAQALVQKWQISHPDSPEVIELAAQSQLAQGNVGPAIDLYRRLATLNPNSHQLQHRIAMLYLSQNNLAGAREALNKSLAIRPNFVDAQVTLAGVENLSGRPDQALTIARNLQKQNAKSPAGFVLEGNIQTAQKRFDAAAQAYEKAFALHQSSPVLIKIHEALTLGGKTKEADSRANDWLKQHPQDTTLRHYLANHNLQRQNNKAAIAQYQALIDMNPKDVAALNNIAIAYQQDKDKRALEYAEKAVALAPQNAAILDTLGWILVEQGDTAKGLPHLRKALELAPNMTEVRYHYAQALLKSGDKAGARSELEKVVQQGGNFSKLAEAKALLGTL